MTASTFGPYEIQRELAQGETGVVYLAHEPGLDRDVVLKLLAPEYVRDHAQVIRFKRAARVAASLDHPHVVHVHRAGRLGQVYYMAMEPLMGPSLEQTLHDIGHLESYPALDFLLQASRGLAAVHARGVVHGDLRPKNLLTDDAGRVRVTDFGLAHEPSPASEPCRWDLHAGVPAYLSPEQCRGEAVDARTDVYTLGIVLYEMLAGNPPFEPDATIEDMLAKANEPFPSIYEQCPKLSPLVAAFLDRLVNRDPNERLADADTVIQECEAVMAGIAPDWDSAGSSEDNGSRGGLSRMRPEWHPGYLLLIPIVFLVGAFALGPLFAPEPPPQGPLAPPPPSTTQSVDAAQMPPLQLGRKWKYWSPDPANPDTLRTLSREVTGAFMQDGEAFYRVRQILGEEESLSAWVVREDGWYEYGIEGDTLSTSPRLVVKLPLFGWRPPWSATGAEDPDEDAPNRPGIYRVEGEDTIALPEEKPLALRVRNDNGTKSEEDDLVFWVAPEYGIVRIVTPQIEMQLLSLEHPG